MAVQEIKIGDPQLQELFDKHGVSTRLERTGAGLTLIRVRFPVPGDLNTQTITCQACGTNAKIVLENSSHLYESFGVGIHFENLQRCSVVFDDSKCRVMSMREDVADKVLQDLREDADTPEVQIFDQCIDGKIPPGNTQREVVAPTLTFMIRRFQERDIKLKRPTNLQIKRALGL